MLEDEVFAAYGDNAFAILGIVSKALRRQRADTTAFTAEATSGDYAHLNEVARAWAVRIDNGEDVG